MTKKMMVNVLGPRHCPPHHRHLWFVVCSTPCTSDITAKSRRLDLKELVRDDRRCMSGL